jgi:transcriptional regulator with XRE-family HTH domain
MTPDDFKAWRKAMGFTQKEAGEVLGITKWAVENYERGSRREDDRPVIIPRSIALACSAVFLGLEPWRLEINQK